jgi:hypothetical protein
VFADRLDRGARALCVACGIGLQVACIDPMRPGASTPPIASSGYDATVVVQAVSPATGPSAHLLRVRWRSGDAAPPIGGFQAELRLPPGLEAIGDVLDQREAHGTMLRQLNVAGTRVLATGIASEGFRDADLFVITVRGPVERVREVTLVLHDIVDARGVNRRGDVRIRREVQ